MESKRLSVESYLSLGISAKTQIAAQKRNRPSAIANIM